MKNIDFLPDIYRQRAAALRARLWWGMLVVMFGMTLGATAIGQQLLRRSVQLQLDALEPRHLASQEQVRKLSDLHAKDQQEGELAALITYLDHPWPRTQLLAEIVRPLPPTVRLTELSLVQNEQVAPVGEADAGAPAGTPEEEAAKKLPPAVHDLTELRKLHDRRETIIEITGQVQDVAPLHGYVAALGRSPLVARARLKSIESAAAEEGQRTTRFTGAVLIRPCHGLPGSATDNKTALALPGGTGP